MSASLTADILVVGGGIAGSAFACALRGRGYLQNRYDELPIPYPYCLIFHHDLLGELLLELVAEDPETTVLRPLAARSFQVEDGEIRGVLKNILIQVYAGKVIFGI